MLFWLWAQRSLSILREYTFFMRFKMHQTHVRVVLNFRLAAHLSWACPSFYTQKRWCEKSTPSRKKYSEKNTNMSKYNVVYKLEQGKLFWCLMWLAERRLSCSGPDANPLVRLRDKTYDSFQATVPTAAWVIDAASHSLSCAVVAHNVGRTRHSSLLGTRQLDACVWAWYSETQSFYWSDFGWEIWFLL